MANWYNENIVPHMIRLGCGCQRLGELRSPIVSQARGRVLELGIGAGANMNWLVPEQVTELVGIEPCEKLRGMTLASPQASRFKLSVLPASAEALPLEDASFDTIVCTFTLCSVTDPLRVLAEARRVLRPGGRLLFCEHGRSPDAGVARWQDRIDPLWSKLTGGCHIHRPIRGAIEQMFSISGWQGGYQERGPRIMGWMESGVAM